MTPAQLEQIAREAGIQIVGDEARSPNLDCVTREDLVRFAEYVIARAPVPEHEEIAKAIEVVEERVLMSTTFEYWFNDYQVRNGLAVSMPIKSMVRDSWNEACLASARLVRGFKRRGAEAQSTPTKGQA